MSHCNEGNDLAGVMNPSGLSSQHRRVVAVVGPPNSGKSTLFNRLTGLHQKVANYPGVTVEKKFGQLKLDNGDRITLVDLPGLYSLDPRTEDECVTHDVLCGESDSLARPDAIILILDSTNLGRNLALAAGVLGLGIPTLVALNMADELRSRGGDLDTDALSDQIGAPVVLMSARRGEGMAAVREFLNDTVLSSAKQELPVIQDIPACRKWASRLESAASYCPPNAAIWTDRLDRVFLHPIAGPVVFGCTVVAIFQAIFTWAQPLMNGVDSLIGTSGAWIASMLPPSWFRSLLIDGVWSGVGSILVFLPQILMLFFFIGVLEDSGYLARGAVIADRVMSKVGLQGKSFIPLLSAYACAIPAVLATRTIENKRDRMATILIAPFMTCSARLPIYILVIAAFVPEGPLIGPFLGNRAAALLALYVLGFVAAIGTARVLKSSILKSSPTPFMLELPTYRWPTLRSLGLRLIDRTKVFLKRAGTVILATALVLSILLSLPTQEGVAPPIEESWAGLIGKTVEPLIEPLGFNWKIGIGLLTSLAAREVIVATLGTIYGMEADERSEGLQQVLGSELTLGGAIALLVFFAFAMQCMSTVAVVRRETGGWKWPLAQWGYMTGLAYVGAFLANAMISL